MIMLSRSRGAEWQNGNKIKNMPPRELIFRNDKIYHIFDKTIDSISIFSSKTLAQRFLSTLVYYRSDRSRMRFSYLKICRKWILDDLMEEINMPDSFRVQIIAYCFMPNHYHLLLRQTKDNGIVTLMRKSLDSITKLYNTIHDRKGPLFLPRFKAKYIKSEEQLIFTSRYIHLNPYEAGVIRNVKDIYTFRFSSIKAYTENINPYQIDTLSILQSQQFQNSPEKYREYIEFLSHPVC